MEDKIYRATRDEYFNWSGAPEGVVYVWGDDDGSGMYYANMATFGDGSFGRSPAPGCNSLKNRHWPNGERWHPDHPNADKTAMFPIRWTPEEGNIEPRWPHNVGGCNVLPGDPPVKFVQDHEQNHDHNNTV